MYLGYTFPCQSHYLQTIYLRSHLDSGVYLILGRMHSLSGFIIVYIGLYDFKTYGGEQYESPLSEDCGFILVMIIRRFLYENKF